VNLIQEIFNKINKKLSNQFLRNFGWLGLSEVILRIVRLVFTVILARFLTPEDYGLAAIVLAVGEFTRIFLDVGIWWKIIQADQQDLEDLCNSSYWLNWVVYPGIFIVQCLLAFPVSWFYQNERLILPICITAIPYLIAPLSSIQYALLHRENKLKIVAAINTVANSSNYILGALFASLGMGLWAIILPGVLFYPIGCFIKNKCHSWRPTTGFTREGWKEIWAFGKNTLGVQLLKVLRNNLDYLIVGRFLGIKELGLYFFGFNAGLGISLSVINALSSALLPHLTEARPDKLEFKKRYFSSLKIIGLIITPLVLLQSSLAPFYVPIIFGHKWILAIPILILICLSAIPRPFADAASQLLIAIGKPNLDLRWNVLFTVIFAGALLIGVQWQAIGVATVVLLIHLIFLPLFTVWATRYVFSAEVNK
jgi:O-antigen/teichoic acid export membrane protein